MILFRSVLNDDFMVFRLNIAGKSERGDQPLLLASYFLSLKSLWHGSAILESPVDFWGDSV